MFHLGLFFFDRSSVFLINSFYFVRALFPRLLWLNSIFFLSTAFILYCTFSNFIKVEFILTMFVEAYIDQ